MLNKRNIKNNRGVTLIELMVVVFIFMVISSITIFSYGSFRSSLSIQNLADDIALAVRRAQGFAIGVRGYGGVFTQGYGVHFTSTSNSNQYAGSNKSFVLFADLSPNNKYDYDDSGICGTPTISNECLELLSIATADSIESMYINDEVNPISVGDTIDISFVRPNPEPIFCYRNGGVGSCNSGVSKIRIKISTDADHTTYKIITISNNGQISVRDI